MKIIIAGSRDFNDYELAKEKILYFVKNTFFNQIEIVSGGARGADRIGEKFAKEYSLKMKIFPPDWQNKGKKAGILRNQEMADYADCLIAFWDGLSKGTMNMIEEMKKRNKPTRIVYY